jgi:hypothetical protein
MEISLLFAGYCVIIGIMRRSGLLVLMILVLSATLLPAQRAGGGSRGGGGGVPGGKRVTTGPSNGLFPQHSGFGHHHGYGYRGYGTGWLPGYFPFWDDDDDWGYESACQQPLTTASPQVIVVEKEDPRPPAPPPEPPKLIEVPQSKEAPVAKRLPPTWFLLTNGEQLESRTYLLTSESLQIQVGRQQRTIPVSSLDLDATVAVDRERGIKLVIPTDGNSVRIGF